MERDAPSVGRELRRLRRVALRELRVALRFLFELLEAAEAGAEVEVLRQRGDVDSGRVPGVDVLVLGAIRDVQRGAGLPVITSAADDAEAGATGDVDRFLTVHVHPGARASGYLRLDERGALRRESAGRADEHRGARVLRCLDPLELTAARDDRAAPDG
jgi:hypothetical protein